ncbi:MAG: DUF4189 domain-containing protein [Candidatus Accumulibacter sp.]|nr:DUF4189 domain-containing protein [Accumulibacter sp.]
MWCRTPPYSRRPQAPQQYWATQWGAVAIDDVNSSLGVIGVTNYNSKKEAGEEVLSECRKKGGRACKVLHSYYNQCVAVAWGTTGISALSAGTLDAALSRVMNDCSSHTQDCEIFYRACSYPVLRNR